MNSEINLPEISDIGFSFELYPTFNLITSITCALYVIRFVGYPVHVTLLPHGKCLTCCPYKEDWEINYYFYSKSVPNGVRISRNIGSMQQAGLNPNLKTVICVHGWVGGRDVMALRVLTDSYLNLKENYNVIQVDWSKMASFLYYDQSAKSTRTVGEDIAAFIVKRLGSKELILSNVHLIGFSLGAQVVGFAGKALKRQGLSAPVITGIDPARPDFEVAGCNDRICSSDGDYVEIVHSNSGFLGLPQPIGQIDFYPNGGIDPQPDCGKLKINSLGSFLGTLALPCSHLMGPMIYALTVSNPHRFPATLYNNATNPVEVPQNFSGPYLGFDAINFKGARGSYYVEARTRKSPWNVIFGESIEGL